MDTLLECWSHRAPVDLGMSVVPDGCRDLIVRAVPGQRPRWFMSPLDDRTREVPVQAGTYLEGFRLRPGTGVDEAMLLASVHGAEPGSLDVADRVQAHSRLQGDISEALEALAVRNTTVGKAALQLGLSSRSVQRLVRRETGRTPGFWLQLARVRGAARAVRGGAALLEVTYTHGFADQSHMTRQFRRFLGVTPAGARTAPSLSALGQSGYG